MQSAIHRLAATALLALLFTCYAAAEGDKASLLGTWSMTSESPDGDVHWNLVLKEADGKMAASLKTPDGDEVSVKDFSYTEGTLRFKAPYHDDYYDVELKLIDGKLDGKWSAADGNSGRTYGTKAP